MQALPLNGIIPGKNVMCVAFQVDFMVLGTITWMYCHEGRHESRRPSQSTCS